MNRKKAVLLISSSIGGGAQILLLDLAEYLRKRIEILIVCPQGYLSDHLITEGFTPVITEVNPKTIGRIRKTVLTWAGNAEFTINPMLFGTAYYVCKAFHNVKNCRILSLLLNPILREDLPFYKKIAYKHIAKVIGKYSDSIGVGSPELEQEVISLTGQQPIYLENRVPNTQSAKRMFYDGNRPLRVCFVGRMAEQKRPDLFVKTAKITSEKKSNIEYFMAGEGHLLEQTKRFVSENELESSVHFVGFQNDLYGFLDAMDVLLLSSEFENTPLIMLNAMNASLPIVCGNVKGVTHLIDNHVTGIITEAFTPAAFAAELDKLAADPELVKGLGEKAYEKALGDLSYERFANTYLEALTNG